MHSAYGDEPHPSSGSSEDPRRAGLRFHRLVDGRMFSGTCEELADLVMSWTLTRRTRITVGVNANVVNLVGSDPDFAAEIARTDLLHADGQSVVWGAKALGAHLAERIATTDLAPCLLEKAAAAQLRLYFLGGEPGVAEEAAARVLQRFPGATIRTHHGYLDPIETERVLEDIADFRPSIVFVGMGDPIQLDWVAEHRDRLAGAVAITCGGLFDWLSNRNRRAPSWMIRLGLEWLYRLIIEPRRLWRRYLLGNPRFITEVVRSAWTVRRDGSMRARPDRMLTFARTDTGSIDVAALFDAPRPSRNRKG